MYCQTAFVYILFAYYNAKVQAQKDCNFLPSNLPLPLKHLLTQAMAPASVPVANIPVTAPSCGCISPSINVQKCGCPEPNCGCGPLVEAPRVPSFAYLNAAIGLTNPATGVQSCACNNAFGACNCGNPVVGNLCGRTTASVGLATASGCADPAVKIVDSRPNCQPTYGYNLPSLGLPSFGYTNIGLSGYGNGGIGVPNYLPSIGLPPCGCAPIGLSCGCGTPYAPAVSCGCNGPCGCPINSCGCKGPCGCPIESCTCGLTPINSCGCIEVPCGPPKFKTTCTCVTPTVETPCGYAQGQPTCACTTTVEVPTCGIPVVAPFAPVIGCTRYLRQVCVQPPFL